VNGKLGTASLEEEARSPKFGEPSLVDTSGPQICPCRSNFYNKADPLSNRCDWRVEP
jgi:hypothetical protein